MHSTHKAWIDDKKSYKGIQGMQRPGSESAAEDEGDVVVHTG